MPGEAVDPIYILEAVGVILAVTSFAGSSLWYFIRREKAATKRDTEHKNDMKRINENYDSILTSQTTLTNTINNHLLASERAEAQLKELAVDVKDHEVRIRALEKNMIALPGAHGTELETHTIGDALEGLRKRVSDLEKYGTQTRLPR